MDPNLMGLIMVALVILAVIYFNRRNEPAAPAQPPTVQPIVAAPPANPALPPFGMYDSNRVVGTGFDINGAVQAGYNIQQGTTAWSTNLIVQKAYEPKAATHIHYHDDRTTVNKTEVIYVTAPKTEEKKETKPESKPAPSGNPPKNSKKN